MVITRSNVWNGEPSIPYGDSDFTTGANTVGSVHKNWDIAVTSGVKAITSMFKDFMGFDMINKMDLKNLKLHPVKFSYELQYYTKKYYEGDASWEQDFIDKHLQRLNEFRLHGLRMNKTDYENITECLSEVCISYKLSDSEKRTLSNKDDFRSEWNWLNITLKKAHVSDYCDVNGNYIELGATTLMLEKLGLSVLEKVEEEDTPKEENVA